jgi:hypothetical protein
MTGTWATKVDVPAQLVLPIGTVSVNVQSTLRMNVAASGSAFIHELEMCALALPTNPHPTALAIAFRPAMLQTLVTTATAPASTPAIGGPVTIPPFTIQTGSTIPCTGSCTEASFIDSDRDWQPGVTLPVTSSGALGLTVDAYAALTVPISLSSASLQDASTITGDAAFGAQGQVLRTNNVLVTGGPIQVTTTSPTTRVSLRRLGAGDIPCSTVLQQLP